MTTFYENSRKQHLESNLGSFCVFKGKKNYWKIRVVTFLCLKISIVVRNFRTLQNFSPIEH